MKMILGMQFVISFFVAVWFGMTPEDDLIDKNFPFFFFRYIILTLKCYILIFNEYYALDIL
jgi:hypothetical protein